MVFGNKPTGKLRSRTNRAQPMTEIAVLTMYVNEQLLSRPAVSGGVMRRRRQVAQVCGARVEHARRATEEHDRERKCCKSAHHPLR
jgi:hypothetical protein